MRRRRIATSVLLAAALSTGAPASGAEVATALRFTDTSRAAGLEATTWCGSPEKPHLLESGGGGVAFFDYDLDGDLDLYLTNAWRMNDGPERVDIAERGRNLLYRNRGDGTFDDVSRSAGADDDGFGTGIAVGDFDGDGWPDLFVSNFGPDVTYRNRGDGTFEEIARSASIDGWSTAAVIFDADRDGDEDIFLGGYIDCTEQDIINAVPELTWEGLKVMLGPFGLEGLGNEFFDNRRLTSESTSREGSASVDSASEEDASGGNAGREPTSESPDREVLDREDPSSETASSEDPEREDSNPEGNITFERVTDERGLDDIGLFYTFAIAALDLDGDRDLDLYAANDSNPNYVYDNDGGTFTEVGLWSGAALDVMGNAQAGMGLATGDLDNDGLVDMLVTNFSKDVSTFYRNLGNFLFEDTTVDLGIGQATYASLSWGAELVDFDHDGDLDLFVSNGHIYPQADRAPKSGVTFRQPNLLLENAGGSFTNVGPAAGDGMAVEESSRGVAAGDIDSDGDIDLAIWNTDAPPTLLENVSATDGAWLLVDVPRAIRARVTVSTDGLAGSAEPSSTSGASGRAAATAGASAVAGTGVAATGVAVTGVASEDAPTGVGSRQVYRHRVVGGSYVSVDDHRLHFGLGDTAGTVDLEIAWPDGSDTIFTGIPVDRVVQISR